MRAVKKKVFFHALDVAAGVVVADKGHDALGEAKGNLHGDGVDLLGDAHGCNGVGAKGGGEVVQHAHAGDIEQVLDGGRDAHGAHAHHNVPLKREHLGVDAHVGPAPLDVEQHKEVQAGHAVGEEGGQARALGAHVQAPGQDEDGV